MLFGPISSVLQSRATKIQESLEAAERVKNEADESAEKLEKEIKLAILKKATLMEKEGFQKYYEEKGKHKGSKKFQR